MFLRTRYANSHHYMQCFCPGLDFYRKGVRLLLKLCAFDGLKHTSFDFRRRPGFELIYRPNFGTWQYLVKRNTYIKLGLCPSSINHSSANIRKRLGLIFLSDLSTWYYLSGQSARIKLYLYPTSRKYDGICFSSTDNIQPCVLAASASNRL